MKNNLTIAIIGCGNMGASLLGGLIKDNYPAHNIWISNPTREKLNILQKNFSVNITQNNIEAVHSADVVILAVKPKIIAAVAKELANKIQKRKPLVITIAAGVRISSLEKWLGGNIAVVRAMPNTPSLIGCGASGLYANNFTNEEQRNIAETILRSVGLTVWLNEETLMDAVTSLSGNGPAYFFFVIEALQNAGEALGLPHDVARLLILQTAYGATRMALETDEDIVTLRKRVTSPGGATEQAIRVFEEEKMRDIFLKALQAATKRSKELAELADSFFPPQE